jgi:hypothetical protein
MLSLSAQAETGYISDKLSVGLQFAPGATGQPVKQLDAGTAVEVLERAGANVRVRDKAGAEGWIESRQLSTEPPARAQLARLQEDLGKARTQLAETQERLKKADAALAQEHARSGELQKSLNEAKTAPPPAPASPAPVVEESTDDWRTVLLWLGVSFAMLGLGFVIGVVWLRESIRRRSGGMYLRV